MIQSTIQITTAEYKVRAERLLEYLDNTNLSGVILFDHSYILYYTGFAFIPTERPMAFLMNAKGEKALLVPRLELEHATANACIDQVESYIEYPNSPHPMNTLLRVKDNLSIQGGYGADHDGYPWIFGYRGPTLTELTGERPSMVTGIIEDQMAIKSTAELALIKESVKWGNLAHMLLQRYTREKVPVKPRSASERAWRRL